MTAITLLAGFFGILIGSYSLAYCIGRGWFSAKMKYQEEYFGLFYSFQANMFSEHGRYIWKNLLNKQSEKEQSRGKSE